MSTAAVLPGAAAWMAWVGAALPTASPPRRFDSLHQHALTGSVFP